MIHDIQYIIANPHNLHVKHNPDRRIPQEGDRIKVNEDFLSAEDNWIDKVDIIKLARKNELIVDSVSPIVVGQNGDYSWHYSVYCGELNLFDWQFTFI